MKQLLWLQIYLYIYFVQIIAYRSIRSERWVVGSGFQLLQTIFIRILSIKHVHRGLRKLFKILLDFVLNFQVLLDQQFQLLCVNVSVSVSVRLGMWFHYNILVHSNRNKLNLFLFFALFCRSFGVIISIHSNIWIFEYGSYILSEFSRNLLGIFSRGGMV